MAVRAKLLKGCYAGNAGDIVLIDNMDDFNRLLKLGYALLEAYETAAKSTPETRRRGRPKKNAKR